MNHIKDHFLPIKGIAQDPIISGAKYREISYSPERLLPMPIPVYDQQQFGEFELGLNLYRINKIITDDSYVGYPQNKAIIPELKLELCTIENAYLVVAPGLDGLIVTEDYHIVGPPSCFRDQTKCSDGYIKDIPFQAPLSDVFVGFDAAPCNYYHWLLYAISKTLIADSILSSSAKLVILSIASLFHNRGVAFLPETYEQILNVACLGNRVTRLDTGIYPVKNLSYCWHKPCQMPELHLLFPEVHALFDKFQVPNIPELPKQFFVSRRKVNGSRITEEEERIIELVLQAKNISTIYLEDLDFVTQVALFRQAELIIAPHGAGLANIVFARPGTALLELNLQLDQQKHLRNCFYLIAAVRRLYYSFFNLSKETLTEELLMQAIEVLKVERLKNRLQIF